MQDETQANEQTLETAQVEVPQGIKDFCEAIAKAAKELKANEASLAKS